MEFASCTLTPSPSENEHEYREEFIDERDRHKVFQIYTNAGGHCEFSNSELAAVFEALVNWVEKAMAHKGRGDRHLRTVSDRFRRHEQYQSNVSSGRV